MIPQLPNIILNQKISQDSSLYFKEVSPIFSGTAEFPLVLSLDYDGTLSWSTIPTPKSIEVSTTFFYPNFFYKDGRIGIGRSPLHSYQFDIAVSENTIATAFHIGDGRFGFSMGNGTNDGFLPEIIGMGCSETDAGLYFIGRAGNTLSSDIPLIILDGRNAADDSLTNRPILGITSADYHTYKLLIDHKGNIGIGKKPEIYKMEVNGEISAKDFVIKGVSLIDILHEQQKEIDDLKNKIEVLTGQK